MDHQQETAAAKQPSSSQKMVMELEAAKAKVAVLDSECADMMAYQMDHFLLPRRRQHLVRESVRAQKAAMDAQLASLTYQTDHDLTLDALSGLFKGPDASETTIADTVNTLIDVRQTADQHIDLIADILFLEGQIETVDEVLTILDIMIEKTDLPAQLYRQKAEDKYAELKALDRTVRELERMIESDQMSSPV